MRERKQQSRKIRSAVFEILLEILKHMLGSFSSITQTKDDVLYTFPWSFCQKERRKFSLRTIKDIFFLETKIFDVITI